ncbi:transmembrane protein 213 [Rhinolophus ferrumequinum]|uniref:Transmembrane protein 213 n=2 Tax=Rhinolophus ferrumequinum TaxID=59479 RepID=A0A7J7RJH1_RHIFE|nr:transmembrane protein 213 [Rhinolophus ferrumequinum]
MVRTDTTLSSVRHLISAPHAALVLSLLFASFHSTCLAEASSNRNSTSTTHHPDPETLEQCLRSGHLANVQGEADQLWKFCTAVCFWERRRSSSRIALMSEAEEWPGWRSSVELVV